MTREDTFEIPRLYVICHMGMSLDGKVTGDFLSLPQCAAAVDAYYQVNRRYAGDAFACGRVTMEGSFTQGFQPDLTPYQGRTVPPMDYVADETATFFAVAFDRRGLLGWQCGRIEDEDPGYGNAHVIEVLCEGAAPEYLCYLQHIGVSYIFAGTEAGELDLDLALFKLRRIFGIKKLLLEGGSILNGAFQREDKIDELSLVTAPVTADLDALPLFSKSRMHFWNPESVSDRSGILVSKYSKQKDC